MSFFDFLEQNMMQTFQDMSHPLSSKKLVIIAKIFYMCNTLSLLPHLIEPGSIDNWIEFVVQVLDHQLPEGDKLITPTQEMNDIESLDKNDYWMLKGICSKISVKLYQK